MNSKSIAAFVRDTQRKLESEGGFKQACLSLNRSNVSSKVNMHVTAYLTEYSELSIKILSLVSYLMAKGVKSGSGNIGATYGRLRDGDTKSRDMRFDRLLGSNTCEEAIRVLQEQHAGYIASLGGTMDFTLLIEDLHYYKPDTKTRWAYGYTGGFQDDE